MIRNYIYFMFLIIKYREILFHFIDMLNKVICQKVNKIIININITFCFLAHQNRNNHVSSLKNNRYINNASIFNS
jgi:hypothetical protein